MANNYTPLEQWLYDTGIAMPGEVRSMAKRIEHSEWLAAHDAEKRAEWEAERAPEKDERLVRYMALVTPLGYQSALTVVQEMTKLLAAEDIARQLAEQAGPWIPAEYSGSDGAKAVKRTVFPVPDTTKEGEK